MPQDFLTVGDEVTAAVNRGRCICKDIPGNEMATGNDSLGDVPLELEAPTNGPNGPVQNSATNNSHMT